MTDEQRGKYILLLCLQHQQGYLCEEDMLNICKTYDAKVYSKFRKADDGFYYNERMRVESEKRQKYSESRSKNRQKKDDISETYDSHMENEDSISFNKGGTGEKEINISFDVFWDAYGKKVGNKKLCIQRWKKLKDEDRQKIINTLPSFVASVSDKKYLPYPEKYLNAQRWNDEVVAPTAPVSSTQQFYPQSKGDPQPFIDRNWRQPV